MIVVLVQQLQIKKLRETVHTLDSMMYNVLKVTGLDAQYGICLCPECEAEAAEAMKDSD